LPPKIAPIQVIIIPILKKNSDNDAVLKTARNVAAQLEAQGIRSKVDDSEKSPGTKFYHWEMKGVPLKIEIGPRDLEAQQVIVSDRLGLAKEAVSLDSIETYIAQKLEQFQSHLFERALQKRASLWRKADKLADFGPLLDAQASFYQTGWCGDRECEAQLKEFKATTRCLLKEVTFKECFYCSKPNKHDVIVAKSY
jgi:prolyl-tRNA synthetase